MFSRSAGYAVQAPTYWAAQPPGKLTGAREIAEEAKIPMPFLWKILRNLSKEETRALIQRSAGRVRTGAGGGKDLSNPSPGCESRRPAHRLLRAGPGPMQ